MRNKDKVAPSQASMPNKENRYINEWYPPSENSKSKDNHSVKLLIHPYQPPEPPLACDKLPEHGILPPGSLLPFYENAVFTGRQEYLRLLADTLLHSDQHAMITGPGGIGKTQLAVDFCYRYARFFHGVHWIRADQSIEEQIAKCGEIMGLFNCIDEISIPNQKELTLQAWREGGPRLVVLDNIEDPQIIPDCLHMLPQARLLFTSRKTDWPIDIKMIICHLDVLPLSDSLVFLRKLAPRLEKIQDKELKAIANWLGCMPLALDLAGRYLLQRPQMSPASYMRELAGSSLRHRSLTDWVKHSPTNHATSLADTFASSWNRLNEGDIDILAKTVLRVCGYCAPLVDVPKELLALSSKGSDEDLDNAIIRLSDWGLIMPMRKEPALHPLIAEFACLQDRDTEESILPALAEAMVEISARVLENGLPKDMRPLHEHLKKVAHAAENSDLQITGALWNNLAIYLRDLGNYEGARQKHEQALKIERKIFGPEHPDIAWTLDNIGIDLQYLGDYEGARQKHEQALKIERKVYGPEHPDVAWTLNNIGTGMRYMGDYEGARQKHEQALNIERKVYGPDHSSVAWTLGNLGIDLRYLGDYEGARQKHEQALEIKKKVYGPDHPDVAWTIDNIGTDLRYMGDYEGARQKHEQALEIKKKVYGPKHPSVARTLDNIGIALRYQSKYDEARQKHEQALEIKKKMYKPDHPDVAWTIDNIGIDLQCLGDYEGARQKHEQALEIFEKIYGPEHPDVARTLGNLGTALQRLNDYEGGKECFKRALKIFQIHIGENHPLTKTVRNNLEALEGSRTNP